MRTASGAVDLDSTEVTYVRLKKVGLKQIYCYSFEYLFIHLQRYELNYSFLGPDMNVHVLQ